MAEPRPSWQAGNKILSKKERPVVVKQVIDWFKYQLKHSKAAWSTVLAVITSVSLWFGYTINVQPVDTPQPKPAVESVEPTKMGVRTSAIRSGVRIGDNEAPVALIQGPDKVNVGSSVWLKTAGSKGFDMKWRVLPESEAPYFTQLPIFGGMDADGKPVVNYWVHYDSPNAGLIHAVFVTTIGNKSAIATHTFRNGEVKPPTPPEPPVPDDPVPEVREPSAQYKEWAFPIIPLIKDKKDAIKLARFWIDMQDIVTRNTELITTTERIRELNIKAGKAAFERTGMKGKYPGLAAAMDNVLIQAIGLKKERLTPEKRMAASKACNAIAWACVQASYQIKYVPPKNITL